MKSTYVEILEDDINEIKTIVPAKDENEARELILYKFGNEFGLDFEDEDVTVCYFIEGRIRKFHGGSMALSLWGICVLVFL